jgi:hypothetical protein
MFFRFVLLHTPEFIKKRMLKELFRLTADSFQTEMPELGKLSFRQGLSMYEEFTEKQGERYLYWEGSPDERISRLEAVEEKLYHGSFILGQGLRKSLHIKKPEQAVEALEAIYRLIGIDFRMSGPDEFIVKECYFSGYYSAEVCTMISSLDEGMAAGLTGGELSFTQRITEGCGCCRGYLTFS